METSFIRSSRKVKRRGPRPVTLENTIIYGGGQGRRIREGAIRGKGGKTEERLWHNRNQEYAIPHKLV